MVQGSNRQQPPVNRALKRRSKDALPTGCRLQLYSSPRLYVYHTMCSMAYGLKPTTHKRSSTTTLARLHLQAGALAQLHYNLYIQLSACETRGARLVARTLDLIASRLSVCCLCCAPALSPGAGGACTKCHATRDGRAKMGGPRRPHSHPTPTTECTMRQHRHRTPANETRTR